MGPRENLKTAVGDYALQITLKNLVKVLEASNSLDQN